MAHMERAPGPDTPLDDMGEWLVRRSAEIDAALAEWVQVWSAFVARDGWVGDGVASPAHWLSWRCGVSRGAAAERTRVAATCDELPQVHDAAARGEVSF